MEEKELNFDDNNSFYYIFHAPLEKVYNIFKTPSLHFYLFFPNSSFVSLKSNSFLDETDSEFSIEAINKEKYSFIIKNVINLPYHKSFTHKNISHPPSCPDFSFNFAFYWNSTDKSTIFKFSCEQKNGSKNNLLNEIIKNQKFNCKTVENYLSDNLKNMEENESITINKNINDVWDFITNIDNQKILSGYKNVEVKKIEENKIEIEENETKNKLIFTTSQNCENEDKKQYNLFLVSSVDSLPKQKIEYILIKMGDNQTFLIFKHIMLEYIAYDILMSYSSLKKKILKTVKNILEENDDNSTSTKDKSEDGVRFFNKGFNNNITINYKQNL